MTIAFVKEVGNAAANPVSATPALTISSAPAAGDLVIVAVAWNSLTTTLSSISDGKGNTWSVDQQVPSGSASISCGIGSTLQDVGTLTTSDTITLHFSASVNWLAAVIHEFSGCTDTVDQAASGSATGISRSAGTTATTTNANDLVYAAFGIGILESSFTAGSGYTAPSPGFYTTATAHAAVDFEYQIVSATGAYNPTGTGGSGTSVGVTAAYMAAAAVSAPRPQPIPFMSLGG